MTRLLLVRHGETELNAQKRFQGQIDEPLNERGRYQVRALRERLADETLHAVYTSDLQRATETAAIIVAGRETAVIVDPRLRELSFGRWEGKTYAQIQAQEEETLAAWEADLVNTAPPGGETLRYFAGRVQQTLTAVHHTHTAAESVLVVAHGGVLQLMLCAALDLPPDAYWHFRLKPASLSEIAFYPAGVIINQLNDTCHLRSQIQ